MMLEIDYDYDNDHEHECCRFQLIGFSVPCYPLKTLPFLKPDKSVALAPCTMRHAPYVYVAQAILLIDAETAEKGRFWAENKHDHAHRT
ncbi:MAG: hypothetical protein JRK53_19605, partial [Deltaproteobacteria bacterium]|nr:hypothetical protein [Deltaproteobacteria bacterium]